MNFEQFKTEFKSQYVTALKCEERGIIAVLSNPDKFVQAIEEDRDEEFIRITNCKIFDYGYRGEIRVIMKDINDGEEYTLTYELISTTLY